MRQCSTSFIHLESGSFGVKFQHKSAGHVTLGKSLFCDSVSSPVKWELNELLASYGCSTNSSNTSRNKMCWSSESGWEVKGGEEREQPQMQIQSLPLHSIAHQAFIKTYYVIGIMLEYECLSLSKGAQHVHR